MDGLLPPICKTNTGGRRGADRADPREYLMPKDAGERAVHKKVVHGLQGLVTQQATWHVGQAMTCPSLSSPAMVLAGQTK